MCIDPENVWGGTLFCIYNIILVITVRVVYSLTSHQTESTVAEDHKQYYHLGYDFDHNHMQRTSDATEMMCK